MVANTIILKSRSVLLNQIMDSTAVGNSIILKVAQYLYIDIGTSC